MKKIKSIEKRNARNSFLFTVPWIIGFIIFFFKPMLQSLLFSFSKVNVTTNGFSISFIGLENYKYILYKSPEYVNNLLNSLRSYMSQIPVILILSLFIAVVLNKKFRGKTFFRSLYFIPVIISTGVVMNYISGDSVMEAMRDSAAAEDVINTYADKYIDFNAVFLEMGLPENIVSAILSYANDIFNLIWKSGIQIVLFLAGLQSIPEQLYEVCKVEGASKWEEFWFITVPMLGNTIVLVTVFTAIEFCVDTANPVVSQAYTVLLGQQIYGQSSSMMWLYFLISSLFIGAVLMLFHKFCLKKWE